MTKFSLLMFGSMFLLYCSPTVEPITFGEDQCTFCKMSIVDKRYGAEVLTTKGRVFKYDALECMINALCENNQNAARYLHSAYIIDFSNPGQLFDAKKGFYLYSKELPSPMGAYLTGFSDSLKANNAQLEYSGEIYKWENVVLKVVGKQTCEYDFSN